uniref:Uncharacterized protein n=1 Tax=Suillus subaureus TaxID=48587 RepID=A0A9P7DJ58_9AGAM|nr:uncharacterized protein BJ212DRAFT_1582452 [Suillus subaureus]KAG1795874.1 hypothetical protein BJ212DRAFT_1582452 [Suillus subaureus]
MKLSLVFSALASIVVLATAYPTQETIAKRSYVEKREDLDATHDSYKDVEEREEFGSNLFNYNEPY